MPLKSLNVQYHAANLLTVMSGKKKIKKKIKKANRVYIISRLYVDVFFQFLHHALLCLSHIVCWNIIFFKMDMECKTELNCIISHSIYVAAS